MVVKKIVIIPTYNEKENIQAILEAIFSLHQDYHVLVIDDGSPDGTADIVKYMMAKFPQQLFIEERSGKLGLGTAYLYGFQWCLNNNYDFIFEMDADFSHNPNDLERLFVACYNHGADVAIGSRYVKGGAIKNWPPVRHFYSRGGSLYTRFITWIPVHDTTAGFVCYSAKALRGINFNAIQFVGYAFQIQMKYACWKLGYAIKEVPITFVDRQKGTSKMHAGIVKEGILGVLQIQLCYLFSRSNPYRASVK